MINFRCTSKLEIGCPLLKGVAVTKLGQLFLRGISEGPEAELKVLNFGYFQNNLGRSLLFIF